MDKDRIEGAAKQAKGAVKDAAGKVTGDTKMQAEGKADKAEGKVQNAVGGAKDAVRDAADRPGSARADPQKAGVAWRTPRPAFPARSHLAPRLQRGSQGAFVQHVQRAADRHALRQAGDGTPVGRSRSVR